MTVEIPIIEDRINFETDYHAERPSSNKIEVRDNEGVVRYEVILNPENIHPYSVNKVNGGRAGVSNVEDIIQYINK